MCYTLYFSPVSATLRSTMKTNPLRAYRKKASVTQTQLATLLGVSYSTVNHIENGRRRITPENARAWEKTIGVSKEDLCPSVFCDEKRREAIECLAYESLGVRDQ